MNVAIIFWWIAETYYEAAMFPSYRELTKGFSKDIGAKARTFTVLEASNE